MRGFLLSGFLALALVACSGSGPGAGQVIEPNHVAPNRGNSMPGSAPSWGSESSASAPMLPYVPETPFEYKCELTLNTYKSPADPAEPRESWYSSTTIGFDNNKTFYSESDLKWGHFYKKAKAGEEVEYAPISAPPYKLDTFASQYFTAPGDTSPVGLALSMAIPGGANVSNRSNVGVFGDRKIGTAISYNHEDRTTKTYTSVTANLNCDKVK